MPPSSHRIVTVRLSVISMAPRVVMRPKCQSKSAPACAARLASSSSEPALVIRPDVLSDDLSSAILLCSRFFVQDCSRVHTLAAGHVPDAVLGLWVAKHHDFDEVAERQEPLKTHGLLKE